VKIVRFLEKPELGTRFRRAALDAGTAPARRTAPLRHTPRTQSQFRCYGLDQNRIPASD
jgi:hypothetical protein